MPPLARLTPFTPYAVLLLLTVGLTLAGIFTRAFESLALFWPVNAILLGLLLRHPPLARPLGWGLLYLGMLVTDIATGNGWEKALWLNLCNLGLILVGWLLLRRQSRAVLRLAQPQGLLLLFLACVSGAGVAATLASLESSGWTVWLIWFGEQFSTGLLLLPAILSAPDHPWRSLRYLLRRITAADLWPLLALGLALAAMLLIGGPGAVVFPLLPLLWCAMRFRPFVVALLGLVSGVTEVLMTAGNLAYFGVLNDGASVDTLTSARLGIAILVLGPLWVASVNTLNRRLMARLYRRANHDFLTGTLNRSALSQRAEELLEHRRRHSDEPPVAVLLLDLDHFKLINDRHGHATGDRVLRSFARLLHEQLRQQDLLARLGGEEFAVVLPGIALDEARLIAERLRRRVEAMILATNDGESLHVTVSIGVSQLRPEDDDGSLDQVLERADEALYRAKANGRNRVELSADEAPEPPAR